MVPTLTGGSAWKNVLPLPRRMLPGAEDAWSVLSVQHGPANVVAPLRLEGPGDARPGPRPVRAVGHEYERARV
jgi:hypothetical protein